LIILAIALVGGLSMLATPAFAADPLGNNGTIKVDRLPFDTTPGNEPHVGCTFQVDFYGFDKGDLNAEVTFTAHAPTLPESGEVLKTDTVFIGEDDSSGGGSEAGLDAEATYTLDLTGIVPHPQQGVHVKLTIHADGAQGADTKYKVFWVTGCGAEESTTSSSSSTSSTTSTTLQGGSSTTASTMASGSSSEVTVSSGGASKAAGLPVTGSNPLPLMIAGLALLGLGVAMITRSRQRRRTRT